MNNQSTLFQRLLVGAIAVSSVLISVVLFTSRSNVPGQHIGEALDGFNQTTNATFQTKVPFYNEELNFDSTDVLVLSLPISARSDLLQPALLIERPLHFIEVRWNEELLTAQLNEQTGVRAVLVPFDKNVSGVLNISVQGEFGRGGIAENIYIGELKDFQHYLQLRTASAILVFAILIFTTVSLLLLVFLRPNFQRLLITASFFFALTMVSLSGVEIWYLLSDSVHLQVRIKTFSIYLSLGLALRLLSDFSLHSSKIVQLGSMGLILTSLLVLGLPSMAHVQNIRELAYILAIPFPFFVIYNAFRYYRESSPETRGFFLICGILLLGGALDLLAVFKLSNLPPSMPIASALFAVTATVLIFIRSSDLANRYMMLVEHSTDAILILDERYSILETNTEAEAIGLRRGKTFSANISDSSIALVDHLSSTKPLVELTLNDSNVRFESIAIQLEGFLCMLVLRDITERKRAETHLLLNTRFETANLIAASVVHDFSNLMTALQGQVSILTQAKKSAEDRRIQKIEQLFNQGNLSIRRLQTLVQTDYTEPQSFEVKPVLDTVMSVCQQQFPKHIQLHVQSQAQPHIIHFNKEGMEQVLMNLLLNAKDELLEHSTGHIWIEDDSTASLLKLHVEDSGKGVPEELRSRIFDPFVSTKPAHQGAGIGLTVVKRLLEDSGGHIELVRPRHGNGAAFCLTIPKVLDTKSQNQKDVNGGQILVLEDEPLILDVLDEVLREGGFTVYTCQDIETAERHLQSQSIQLLISDIILSSKETEDGFEFAMRMYREQRISNVLMMSGYVPDNITDFPEAWSFIQKPFRRDPLIQMIVAIFQGD